MSSNQSVKKKRPYVKPSICVIQGEKEHILAGTPVRGRGGAGSLEYGGELTPDAKPAYPSAYELFHAYDSACASSRHKSMWGD